MAGEPTTLQIELFRAVEDIHELTGATVVLLTDAQARTVAVSGDEADIPSPIRSVLGGDKLREAGSVIALLSPVAKEVADWRVNVAVHAVDGGHVLAIAFDAEADLAAVQAIGKDARVTLAEILRAAD
jgi:hypothetical protein